MRRNHARAMPPSSDDWLSSQTSIAGSYLTAPSSHRIAFMPKAHCTGARAGERSRDLRRAPTTLIFAVSWSLLLLRRLAVQLQRRPPPASLVLPRAAMPMARTRQPAICKRERGVGCDVQLAGIRTSGAASARESPRGRLNMRRDHSRSPRRSAPQGAKPPGPPLGRMLFPPDALEDFAVAVLVLVSEPVTTTCPADRPDTICVDRHG